MKNIIFFMLLLFSNTVYSQLNDEFADGDFSSNPNWTGSNSGADFSIINNRLRSNSNTASSSFYLSTANNLAMNVKWEFWVNIQFNPSGSNYADIYLISDKADLKNAAINGYFIRIGGTDDEISLFKRSGAASGSTKLIDGVNGILNSSNNTIKVKVSRSDTGIFILERETGSTNSGFYTEGTMTDISFTNSGHFGIFIQQSSPTFFQKHFFDDFKILPLVADTSPPELNGISVLNAETLELSFNEIMDSISIKKPANFNLSNYDGSISSVSTSIDPAKYRLGLSKPLNTGNYTLKISGVKDRAGNLISTKDTISFPYVKPYSAIAGDIIINEIFADPGPQIDLPSVEFVELYNTTKETISIKTWKFSDQSSISTLGEISMDPESFLILCAKSDTAEFKKFGKVLGISPWPSLNNSGDQIVLKNVQNITIDSLSYSDQWHRDPVKRQGGWSLERADPKSICAGAFNWYSSKDSTGGSPGKINSTNISGYDLMELKADSLTRTSDSTLIVYFNKHLANLPVKNESFQLIPDDPRIKEIRNDSEFKQTTLIFNKKFLPGTSYQLKISELKDCSGVNINNSKSLSFKIPDLPKPAPERTDTAHIYITEIFADPSPEIGLPLAEFIEIFNTGTDTVNLAEWSLSDIQTKAIMKKLLLPPKQYLILCPLSDTVQYKDFGKVLGLSPWPSLNNNSEQIVLKSFRNRLVDSVFYSASWYGDDVKKQGGWTLERIDPLSGCSGIFNWSASTDKSGGTPGRLNSVHISHYDILNFKADSLNKTSDSTLTVYFNKAPDTSGINKENFRLSPEAGSDLKIMHTSDQKKLKLIFSEKFKPGTNYLLNLSNLKDCNGNSIQVPEPLKFSIPEIPKPPAEPLRTDTVKLIITEIFADPSPEIALPLVEFIEVYNPGKDTADLSGWSISDLQSKAIFKKFKLPPQQYLIICPEADSSQYKAMGRTLGINPWPSLNNSSDQISLKSFNGRSVDSVSYSSVWYKDLKKKAGGWSLEKADLSENSCKGFYNWGASDDPKGGTPGQPNSLSAPIKNLKIDTLKLISDSSFSISFSSIPDTNNFKLSNFTLSNQMGNPEKLTVDPGYHTIDLVFKEKFKEGNRYELKIDSLISCSGLHIQGSDAQITFEIPAIAEKDYPLIISEIMADPSPVRGLPEAEYVELFNPTEKPVELAGLKFGSSFTFSKGELKAGAFLILCAVADSARFKQHGSVQGIQTWPGLKNNADMLTLSNNKGREIHRVEFKQAWYKDPEKQKGGYSLELIDPGSICPAFQNWAASRDSLGGSPGRTNSLFQVNNTPESLKLTEIELLDSLTLLLGFNKSIDSLRASNPENYSLNNGAGKASLALPLGPEFNKVRIKFDKNLSRGMNYSLVVDNVCDCRNTLIKAEFNKLEFFYPKKIEKNDILLTEILFNPRPGGADFVEIYNNTEYPVDLKEISLGKSSGDNLSSLFRISTKQTLLEPGKYLALSPDPDNIRKEYLAKHPNQILKMSAFPAFNDDSGTAILISNNKQVDRLSYQEKMHFPLLKNVEGTSLERRKLNQATDEPGNLRSATTASGGASPGYQNSQYSDELPDTESFKLVSKTFSPDNDGFEDFIEMKYRFDESGSIANVSVFNDRGQAVKKILKNYTLNAEGSFQWDGFDENSQLAPAGIYIIHAEVFNTKGNTKIFKRSFALAGKFK
ncbi:lamin tail domain-containing protein [Daejeonella sp. H1SJ63]|uniref:lamin tail domain-containing protein n=1 Tax=Daejeonella sp. H1SJ63 TaxID=3034145 RepID=UPI0023EE182C|nr:lamin tail domain-containing protein [Daejeonella sp. H1SJ63]